jgi:hypothetical protein
VALHGVLTGLQKNKLVAVLLQRQSYIAFASPPIGTIVLSSIDKAGRPIRSGFVTLQRNRPIQLNELINIKQIACTDMYSFKSANIGGRRTQIFELSGFGHFSKRMLLKTLIHLI